MTLKLLFSGILLATGLLSTQAIFACQMVRVDGYETASCLENNVIVGISYQDYSKALFNQQGKVIKQLGHREVGAFVDGIATINNGKHGTSNELFGYIDNTGQEIPAIYTYAENFVGDVALVKNAKGKYGYINRQGETVIPFQYDYATSFKDGYAVVQKKNKYAVIDKNNKIVVPYQKKELVNLNKGRILRAKNKKHQWEIFDFKNNKVLGSFRGSFQMIKDDMMLINLGTGVEDYQYVLQSVYQHKPLTKPSDEFKEFLPNLIAFNYHETVADDKEKNVYQDIYTAKFYNFSTAQLVATHDDRVHYADRSYQLIPVKHDKRVGVLNEQAEFVLPMIYHEIGDIDDIILPVRQGQKWGVVDRQNKTVIPFEYQNIESFHYMPLTLAKKDNVWNIIDRTGKMVKDTQYEDIKGFNFQYHLAPVKKDGKWGVINRKGEEVVAFEYDDIQAFVLHQKLLYAVKLDKKWGMLNTQGKLIIPIRYDKFDYACTGRVDGFIGDKTDTFDEDGELIKDHF